MIFCHYNKEAKIYILAKNNTHRLHIEKLKGGEDINESC